eukprot:TRINITY_DN9209_c0_g1_i1.p1 TRINITY_DN9209_c0_g1~~TRINITY_DN9209_c0_g1_i1.p1  ORF type:complete len:581 (-),score=124.65 TRINITY_DN9209_c0_g1_i1:20-1762(-)
MKVALFFSLFLLTVLGMRASDPCTEIPTCQECVAETFCGWCSEFIVYENGKRGRNCAYQGPDAVAFYCPKDYQTETCKLELFTCNNVTFQCVPSDDSTGTSIEDCVHSCFPPTYKCDESTNTCISSKPGEAGSTSLEVCNATCGVEPEDMYICDTAKLTCELAEKNQGGATWEVCNATCGQPSNNTPAFTKGHWRGLQVNKAYKEGEWRMDILPDNTILIERPDKSVYAAGSLAQMQNELWIENQVGIMRGIYMTTQLPSVLQLTWAIGSPGEIVPNNFDSAMEEGTPADVFVFWKCLDGNSCNFDRLSHGIRKRVAPKVRAQGIDDACSAHSDCETCIGDKENRCGWCDVHVFYKNGTVEGTNCAGHNADGTKEPFICNSVYSTETCSFPTDTQSNTDTASDTDSNTDSNTDTDSTQDTTDQGKRYNCNATSASCEEGEEGTFEYLVDCEAQCVAVPDIPIDLLGTWRGLEIREGFVVGEWRAEIDQGKISIMSPDGKLQVGSVKSVGPYLVLDLPMGRITTIWQISFSAVTRNLQWAWGEPGKGAPANFNEGLVSPNTEFAMVSCIFGKPSNQCDFSF